MRIPSGRQGPCAYEPGVDGGHLRRTGISRRCLSFDGRVSRDRSQLPVVRRSAGAELACARSASLKPCSFQEPQLRGLAAPTLVFWQGFSQLRGVWLKRRAL